MNKECQHCKKILVKNPKYSYNFWNKQKFCSRGCYSKNKIGFLHTKKTKKRMAQAQLGEKHHFWKGEKAGYASKHEWVERKLGKPKYCEHCKKTDKKKYEWSNKDHKNRRIISDWQRLCNGCHKKFDYKFNNRTKKGLKTI